MQHSLETFGLATALPRPLKTQILPPFLTPDWKIHIEGSGSGFPRLGPPSSPESPGDRSGARRRLGGGAWGFSGPAQQNRKRPAQEGGERKEGAGAEERGEVRVLAECLLRGAPEPPGGCIQAMALRLVADFDLRKDVLPWLQARRATSAGAGARGGSAGAGGAHPGWREAGGGRQGW